MRQVIGALKRGPHPYSADNRDRNNMGQHGGGSAVAFAWEMQLLNTAVTTNVA
jgi:hypothetical protein